MIVYVHIQLSVLDKKEKILVNLWLHSFLIMIPSPVLYVKDRWPLNLVNMM